MTTEKTWLTYVSTGAIGGYRTHDRIITNDEFYHWTTTAYLKLVILSISNSKDVIIFRRIYSKKETTKIIKLTGSIVYKIEFIAIYIYAY